MARKKIQHPGKVLFDEFMKPRNIKPHALAKKINVPANRIGGIINGSRSITPDTSLRLGLFFKVDPEYWGRLQAEYDLFVVKEKTFSKIKKEIAVLNA